MDTAFQLERITKAKALVIVYEDALTALGLANTQSYTLDTGQNKQTVSKLDIKSLTESLDSLLNRIATMESHLYGNGSHTGGLAW